MTPDLPPLRKRLNKLRQETNVELSVYERDYLLSFVLAAMSQVSALSETIVFKGGTALRKCYFAGYRFSEDLDFSALETFNVADLERLMSQVCEVASEQLNVYEPFQVGWKRLSERAPHPHGQQAFYVLGKFPWHTHENTWARIKLEISVDEKVCRAPVRKALIHSYEESIDAHILTYCLEEIVAEKLRGLLQWARKLDEKPFAKPRARDYYDLWKLLHEYEDQVDLNNFSPFLKEKCDLKQVSFTDVESFFADKVEREARQNWDLSLKHLVPDLLSFDVVAADLRISISKLLATTD